VTTRTRKVIRFILIANLILSGLSAIALLWLSQTERGRETSARWIEKIVDGEIPGSMSIGKIESFGTPTVVHKIQFRDPKGALVIEADRAEINFDLMAAFDNMLAWNSAKVQGGRVFIAIDPSGRTTIEEALSAPVPEPDPDPHGGLYFSFRNIEVEGVHLTFRGSPDEGYRVRGIRGKLDIFREDTIGARVLMKEVSGDLEEKLAGMPVRLVSVTGWVHGAEKHVLNLHALASIAGANMNAHVKYFDRDKKPVEIVLSKTNGLAAEVTALLVYFQSMTTEDLEVRLVDS
jgi:hypothetical protein